LDVWIQVLPGGDIEDLLEQLLMKGFFRGNAFLAYFISGEGHLGLGILRKDALLSTV